MDQRDTSQQSRRRLKICLMAALELHGTGISLTVRAGRSFAALPFFLNLFRLSAQFGNAVYYMNISPDDFNEAATSWERNFVEEDMPSTGRRLRMWWTAAVTTACIPTGDDDEEVDDVGESVGVLRLQ